MAAEDASHSPVFHEWRPGDPVGQLGAGELRVFVVSLGDDSDRDVAFEPATFGDWAILDDVERARALRFVRGRDRRRFAVCRAALRRILGALLEVPPGAVEFAAGTGGKPVLAAGIDRMPERPLHFNVSHSGELALIAACRGRELGVDIEQERPVREAKRIVESYFTPAELDRFAALDDLAQELAFLRGWTRKEAILKAIGVGLAGLATGYETMFGDDPLTPAFRPAGPRFRVHGWQLWEGRPRAGYIAALAVHDPDRY
ncbi:4'-phosphopantetheinyl transferase psf-1 [Aquisphaera giovannonii]|uniref:4'-phosphopantetheinyl transferase psf-1 n=1 Tax=Aquisphaera giovannonii TaxID=406548 RepID=A0A5B9W2A9_9BACT|nr:4'-phosphopantetheinyl transferase superfamily protein [Aquisphaera giovannonii]QEH34713.1 4'-phosphopantetheinyl transferase psf-1 [Aquisphaera giovannonii]